MKFSLPTLKVLRKGLKKIKLPRISLWIILSPLLLATTAAFVFLLLVASYWGRVYPGVKVAEIPVGGKTPEESLLVLQKANIPNQIQIKYIDSETQEAQIFKIETTDFDAKYDLDKTIASALKVGRSGNFYLDIQNILTSLFGGKTIGFEVSLSEEKLAAKLSELAGTLAIEPIFPSATLSKGELTINKGRVGFNVDTERARAEIGGVLSFNQDQPIEIIKNTTDPTLSPTLEKAFYQRALTLKDKTLNINFEFQNIAVRQNDLLALINPYFEKPILKAYSEEKIQELVDLVAQTIERPAQNPVFKFEGGRVGEFAPAQDGVVVQREELSQKIKAALLTLETQEGGFTLEPPVTRTQPEIQTGDVNDLGIKELIGRGTSRYRGSIPGRVYNVALATQRINGALIKPGETFSFNKAVGEVSKETGYKEAYVIEKGKTVLGDGGGVCQVSTTFFRAALNAGLPIAERRGHSYRVGYYEQDSPPGIDATVAAPTTDLKIVNDTPGHILVQAKADSKNATLVFELYGTSDGRVAKITKPTITDSTPPADDLYQDDPSLPLGTIKQIEHKAWGAKVSFVYTVTKAGETIYQKTIRTNYQPWQAVYLRGTGPTN